MMKHRGHQPRCQPGLMGERQTLIVRARQRQRPAFADQPHIRQRLLDGDAADPAAHDEDEIEIAVADLADRPVCRRPAELARGRGKLREIIAQIGLQQYSVVVRP